jgi:hypothetical protein
MRRIILLGTVALVLALMMAMAGPVFAQGGCKDFGNAVASFSQEVKPLGKFISGVAPVNDEVSQEKVLFCG